MYYLDIDEYINFVMDRCRNPLLDRDNCSKDKFEIQKTIQYKHALSYSAVRSRRPRPRTAALGCVFYKGDDAFNMIDSGSIFFPFE